ncbi:efflux transporter outer membrane subunit [Marinilabiliaceae bacterium JC017]|nr:efflux transporter outer membrane subunit [Marinilabiliaceae bacterium JC017]
MNNRYINSLLTGLLLLLAGLQSCVVSKQYERSDQLPVSDNYRMSQVDIQTDSLVDPGWRNYFKDPVLIKHIETAINNNRDYVMASHQLLRADALVKQARAAYIPTLNASATAQNAVKGDQPDSYLLNGDVSWEVDLWGKIRSNKRAAVADFFMAKANQQAFHALLIAQVAQAYIQLMALDEQYELTKQTLSLRLEHVKTMQALKEAGRTNEAGVQQALAQRYQVESLLCDLENSILLQENALSILLGHSPQAIERESLGSFETLPVKSVGVPSELLDRRPDVKAAELKLIKAFELTNVARAQYYPSVTLSANGGYNAMKLSEWIKPGSLLFNVAGSLVQPVINGRRIRTQHEIAKINQQDALLSFEQSLINAGKEVSDALFNIQLADKQLGLKQKQLEAEQRALESSRALLNQGMVNYLEVLLAQESVLNSQLNIIGVQSQQWAHRIQLYKALGGGIDE